MEKEKRRARRMDISVSIRLKPIESDGEVNDFFVDVINISRSGMAFKSTEELKPDNYYDTQITIWTKERIETVVRIVRKEGDTYGGEFVGLSSADEMKINIYEMFNYSEDNEE